MKGMQLSIIIINFNTRELLKKCLESIENEKKAREREIIVIDNASSDDSRQMVEKEFPSVNLILNSENVGFAKAVNKGLAIAKGESVLLLNSDTQLKKGSLENLLEFEERVRPAIVGMKMINPGGTSQPSVFHLPTLRGAVSEYWLGEKGSFSKYEPLGGTGQEVEAVSGGAMLISRNVLAKIGLLDERYFFYFEDLDYCRRARKAGFKVYYLPSAEVVHEHGASGRNLVSSENQWRRLIPSSKIYHGAAKHFIISLIIWSGKKINHSLTTVFSDKN